MDQKDEEKESRRLEGVQLISTRTEADTGATEAGWRNEGGAGASPPCSALSIHSDQSSVVDGLVESYYN